MKFVFAKSKKTTSGRRKVSIVFSPYNIRDFTFPSGNPPQNGQMLRLCPGMVGGGGGGGREVGMFKVLIYRRIIL